MKKLLLIILTIYTLASCTKSGETVSNYFSYPDSLEAGGVK
jgi:proline iminopeptidase